MIQQLVKLIQKAETSAFYRWVMNVVLRRVIPFNAPHKLRITSISKSQIEIVFPYKRSNLNHIKGLHACGLATVSEYATGLLLLYNLDAVKYRIIMQSLQMQFHYQGKTDGKVVFTVSPEWIHEKIHTPLQNNDEVLATCEAKVFDTQQNHLSTCITTWQIKKWEKVKTKL